MLSGFAIERSEVLRWSGCFAAVVVAHGLLAWAVLSDRDPLMPPGGAPIVIELESLPAAPQQQQSENVAGPEQMQSDSVSELEPDPVQETEPTKIAKAETVPELETRPIEDVVQEVVRPAETAKPTEAPATVETVTSTETAKLNDATPVETIPTDVTPKPRPPTEEAQPAEPVPELPVIPETEVALSIPLPPPPPPELEKKRKELKTERPKAAKPKRAPRRRSARATTAPSTADRRAARAAARHFSMDRNASLPSWKSSIVAHLQRHKRYPAAARASGGSGTAYLSFTMDRAGRILSSRLTRGSGVPSLDQETLSLIRRAQPLPAAPADVVGRRFTFTVPIRFSLK